ncbi:MAG: transposase family protein [Desulfobacterales bacterium]|nr:MAG: transposase family protein [Desulfobacterales bacterium]UCG07349.1 MAG: transposase family protein [Desulfobacterales bacterium]
MDKKSKGLPFSWAQLRFSIIGALLARPPGKGQLRKELQILAGRHYRHPTEDKWITLGVSTLERWYYKALNAEDPIKALDRKPRSDAGQTKAMSPPLLAALQSQYQRYPDWSYKLHSDNLAALAEQQPELGDALSYSTVIRRMKARGWYKKKSKRRHPSPGQKLAAQRLEQREVRSFESEYVNALWHLDFHQGRRIVDVNGQWHTPVALCVLDDRSRLCCHIQWYLNETAEALYHGLMQAFCKRGLPRSLMTDNGAAMIAQETQNALGRLAITHDTTLPYSPYQNGKQEAFWAQLEGRLIKMLSRVQPLTLQFLNQASQAWIEMEYNRCRHEEINQAPIERFIKGPDVSRRAPDTEMIQRAFTVAQNRSQRQSDGTIRINNIRFEIPSRFRHLRKLQVRYRSWDLSLAYLVDQRTANLLARIYPQDKIKNSQGYRRTLQPIAEEPLTAIKDDADPIPPLLRKLIADYAATGLPPAYIPKEESMLLTANEFQENKDEP